MKVSYKSVCYFVQKGWSYKEIGLYSRVSPSTIRSMVVSDRYLDTRYKSERLKEAKVKNLKKQQLKLRLI